MAQQTINTTGGATGHGDDGLTVSNKVNANFTELYAMPAAQASFTAGSVLIGNGTGAVSAFNSTADRLVIGNGASGLKDSSALTYNSTTHALSVGGSIVANNDNTDSVRIGALPADPTNYAGIWIGQASPDATNYALLSNATTTALNAPTGASLYFKIGNSIKMSFTAGNVDFNNATQINVAGIQVGTAQLTYLTDLANNIAYMQTGVDSTHSIVLYNRAASSAKVPFSIQGASGQTASLQEWQNSAGTAVAAIDASGNFKVGTNQVVGARVTGWTTQTAVASKADLGAAPTVGALAQWASAIQSALTAHGLIGA